MILAPADEEERSGPVEGELGGATVPFLNGVAGVALGVVILAHQQHTVSLLILEIFKQETTTESQQQHIMQRFSVGSCRNLKTYREYH